MRRIDKACGTVVLSLAFADDENLLVGGYRHVPGNKHMPDVLVPRPEARIWNIKTGKPIRDLDVASAGLGWGSLALAPDRKIVAVAYHESIRLWSLSTGKLVRKILAGPTLRKALQTAPPEETRRPLELILKKLAWRALRGWSDSRADKDARARGQLSEIPTSLRRRLTRPRPRAKIQQIPQRQAQANQISEVHMPRTLLVSFLALAVLLALTWPAPGQAPEPVPPPRPLANPAVGAVTYFAGPGVVYYSSPKYTFQAGTNLPGTVYPPGYGNMSGYGFLGGYGYMGGRGWSRPRGMRTYNGPGYMVPGYRPTAANP